MKPEHHPEYLKARADLIAINDIIFAAGAPFGSAEYFRIRVIAATYAREVAAEAKPLES